MKYTIWKIATWVAKSVEDRDENYDRDKYREHKDLEELFDCIDILKRQIDDLSNVSLSGVQYSGSTKRTDVFNFYSNVTWKISKLIRLIESVHPRKRKTDGEQL